MSKKNNQRCGTLFSPELGEITRRLKRKEPEFDEMLNREGAKEHEEEGTEHKIAEESENE